jgi:endo-1,4-beta-xylanase
MFTRREYLQGMAATGLACATSGPRAILAQAGPATEARNVTGPASLKAHGAAKGLLVGCALGAEQIRNDERCRSIVEEQFNLVVPENCMKFGSLRPTPGSYFFEDADAIVEFAHRHGMTIRGHNFVWHNALPKWFEATVTKENARQFLTEHILTVGRRYRGKMHSWDVVNEAIDVNDARPDGLRKTPWMDRIGAGYIELAYQTARQADPTAKLTYNEYGIEDDSPENEAKRRATLALLRRLKAAEAPIDALGIQSHIRCGSRQTFGQGLRSLIDEVTEMGLEVFITEMDVNDDDVQNDDEANRDELVASAYKDFLNIALENKKVTAVLTWGVTDNHTWLNDGKSRTKKHPERRERCLPFDDQFQPAQAFFAIRDSLDHASKRLPGTTSAAGL